VKKYTKKGIIMWLIPAFELGIWNAWILMLPFFLVFLAGQIINKKKFEDPPLTKKEKKFNYMYTVALFVSFIYPIFLPLKLGTVWFYAGFIVYLVGLLFAIIAEISFATASANKLLTKGVYSISRHPMYFSIFLVSLGISMVCISWVFLLLAVIFLTLANSWVSSEERSCLKKYGAAYREYMNRTPRWIGIPKSSKNHRES
jgi:protein-S-isoprenylcysteine O-methyltransferase Ste14